MRWLTLIILVGLLAGCNSSTAPETVSKEGSVPANGTQVPAPSSDPNPTTSVSQSGANDGGIAPMTTAPIGNAPISGGESVDGGGSNVGAVAKDRAKQAAAQASTPSTGGGSEGE